MAANGWCRLPLPALVPLLIASLTLAGCFGTFFGTSLPAELRDHGVAAKATILDISDTGWSVNDDPVVAMRVKVQPPEGDAFEATIKRFVISRIAAEQPHLGQVIPVRFDPKDHANIAVDTGE